MVKIAPTILNADYSRLGLEVENLNESGADFVHIDIMDGNFVPNITIGPDVVKAIRRYTTITFDVHLMINEPSKYIEKFAQAGADIITIHKESSLNILKDIELIKSLGKKAGLSINPGTRIDEIENMISKVDLLLIMSVNPGFGGQEFIKESLEKIRKARILINDNNLSTLIEVDGGINLSNAKEIADAGADILAVGSAIFGSSDKIGTIQKFKNI